MFADKEGGGSGGFFRRVLLAVVFGLTPVVARRLFSCRRAQLQTRWCGHESRATRAMFQIFRGSPPASALRLLANCRANDMGVVRHAWGRVGIRQIVETVSGEARLAAGVAISRGGPNVEARMTGRLADEFAIRTLQQDYFRTVDGKDWAGFSAVMCEDTVFDFRQAVDPGLRPVCGRENVVEFVRQSMASITSAHCGFLRKLEFTGDDTASALWAMQDVLWTGNPGGLKKLMHGYGHYHLDYRCEKGVWRISRWLLTRTFVEQF